MDLFGPNGNRISRHLGKREEGNKPHANSFKIAADTERGLIHLVFEENDMTVSLPIDKALMVAHTINGMALKMLMAPEQE